MTDIFDELRVIAADSKGLAGEDRKKLVQAADEHDRLVAQIGNISPHAADAAAVQFDPTLFVPILPAKQPIEEMCTQFAVIGENHLFTMVCGKPQQLVHKDNPGVFASAFEPVFLIRTSPQSIKDLLILLHQQVISYEQSYGPIVTELSKRMSAMQPSPQRS